MPKVIELDQKARTIEESPQKRAAREVREMRQALEDYRAPRLPELSYDARRLIHDAVERTGWSPERVILRALRIWNEYESKLCSEAVEEIEKALEAEAE